MIEIQPGWWCNPYHIQNVTRNPSPNGGCYVFMVGDSTGVLTKQSVQDVVNLINSWFINHVK